VVISGPFLLFFGLISIASPLEIFLPTPLFGGRGQKYTKYNKINNNLENFRGGGKIASPPGLQGRR